MSPSKEDNSKIDAIKEEFNKNIKRLETEQSSYIKNLITLVNCRPENFKSKSILNELLNSDVFSRDYKVADVLHAPEAYMAGTIEYVADMVKKALEDDAVIAKHTAPLEAKEA